jgi:protein SCO1/2
MPWSRLLPIVLAALAAFWAEAASARNPSPWNEGYLPNAPVVTQEGKTVRFYDELIKGRTVLISFIYTSCPNICPVVTARLSQVQDKLGDAVGRDVHFVSISIDPETDTPAKLKAYAQTFGAGPGWTFLTGNASTIAMLRHKLGERSRKLVEHNNTVLLYNDVTGEWSRDSAFSDLSVLAANIRAMNPGASASTAGQDSMVRETSVTHDLPGQSLFIKTCAACHTVGKGDRVGPDLASLSKRRSRDWTVRYLMAPETMRKEGDPAALDLAARFPTVRMPTLSLSAEDAGDLIAYIDAMAYAAGAGAAKPSTGHSADADHAGHHHH